MAFFGGVSVAWLSLVSEEQLGVNWGFFTKNNTIIGRTIPLLPIWTLSPDSPQFGPYLLIFLGLSQ